jgi:Domain of unknown function (DUF4389)
VLFFLWLGFFGASVVAFVAILITGCYPRPLFGFTLGVLRWNWRVNYYGYSALGTDRYPPFTLAEVPDYPARLDVPYPGQLSRGLVLVKWWLLTLPHYLILSIFVGGGLWLGSRGATDSGWRDGWMGGGLVGLLVLIAAIVLLFTGRYPPSLPLRHGHEALDAPGGCVRKADDRRLPALPARPGRHRPRLRAGPAHPAGTVGPPYRGAVDRSHHAGMTRSAAPGHAPGAAGQALLAGGINAKLMQGPGIRA